MSISFKDAHDHSHEHDDIACSHESKNIRDLKTINIFNNHHDHGHEHKHMDKPGSFETRSSKLSRKYDKRAFCVGIGGPVGSGKTALMLALCLKLRDKYSICAVTNDIFTREDCEFLLRNHALSEDRIMAVETGGCPHAAIREDITMNLLACEELTERHRYNNSSSSNIQETHHQTKKSKTDLSSNNSSNSSSHHHHDSSHNNNNSGGVDIILLESGGDNLAADFSRELADLTIYVIDTAGGDKIPRKGGPGITQSDLLVINKTDLATAVGASLDVMKHDAAIMRQQHRNQHHDHNHSHDSNTHNSAEINESCISHTHTDTTTTITSGPIIFAQVKHGPGVDEIVAFIEQEYHAAIAGAATSLSSKI